MLPGELDLTIYRGDTFGPLTLTCKDADAVLVNLTGYSVYSEARASNSAAVAIDFNPAISATPADGTISFTLTDEQTELLTAGRYEWDLIVEDAAGARRMILRGICSVLNSITQPA